MLHNLSLQKTHTHTHTFRKRRRRTVFCEQLQCGRLRLNLALGGLGGGLGGGSCSGVDSSKLSLWSAQTQACHLNCQLVLIRRRSGAANSCTLPSPLSPLPPAFPSPPQPPSWHGLGPLFPACSLLPHPNRRKSPQGQRW